MPHANRYWMGTIVYPLNYGLPSRKKNPGCNLSLLHAPLLRWEGRGLSELTSPTAIHTLKWWDALDGPGGLASQFSTLTPLGGSPWFALGEHFSFFWIWAANGEMRCCRFVQDHGLMPLAILRALYGHFLLWMTGITGRSSFSFGACPKREIMHVNLGDSSFHFCTVWDVAVARD